MMVMEFKQQKFSLNFFYFRHSVRLSYDSCWNIFEPNKFRKNCISLFKNIFFSTVDEENKCRA
jgi:hypothetical protein